MRSKNAIVLAKKLEMKKVRHVWVLMMVMSGLREWAPLIESTSNFRDDVFLWDSYWIPSRTVVSSHLVLTSPLLYRFTVLPFLLCYFFLQKHVLPVSCVHFHLNFCNILLHLTLTYSTEIYFTFNLLYFYLTSFLLLA